jgi:hypothetical protein
MLSTLFSLTPQIYKAEFDNEANLFLHKYFPEALQSPVAVPIVDVARKRMGLRVVERRLSEDLSILGQMCFTNGLAEIYDKDNDEFREYRVRYGTMIIDPDTIRERNEGCKNNTVAHECYHWHKHRDYHISVTVRDSVKAVKKSCYYEEKPESTYLDWNDEDWMEWQATNVAPRILMPLESFHIMVEQFLREYADNPAVRLRWYSLHNWVVNSVASFFKVSKQSAGIRLNETGYCLR